MGVEDGDADEDFEEDAGGDEDIDEEDSEEVGGGTMDLEMYHKELDLDKDGMVSIEEMTKVLTAGEGETLEVEEEAAISVLFDKADTNHDKKLTLEEVAGVERTLRTTRLGQVLQSMISERTEL